MKFHSFGKIKLEKALFYSKENFFLVIIQTQNRIHHPQRYNILHCLLPFTRSPLHRLSRQNPQSLANLRPQMRWLLPPPRTQSQLLNRQPKRRLPLHLLLRRNCQDLANTIPRTLPYPYNGTQIPNFPCKCRPPRCHFPLRWILRWEH